MPEWETRQAWEGIFPVQEEGELLLSLLRMMYRLARATWS
jgi:hypothetical protein